MTRLRDHLTQLIANQGPISVAEFMRSALTAPELGYYMQADPFGARGDFTTAPEISQVFGELIGAWTVAVWQAIGAPAQFSLIELGPGRGTLMRDALRAARVRPAFLAAAEVTLVEISPGLRARQRETLKDATVRSLIWRDEFAAAADRPFVVIANEFFDALPMRQFVATKQGWRERCVGLSDDGTLGFTLSTVPWHDASFPQAAEGAVYEFAPARDALAMRIGAQLAASTGAALVIDYGFLGPAIGDTMQAMQAHGFVAPLDAPGHADVTSHVDFTALGRGFADGGAQVFGPLTQADFIARLGGGERTAMLASRATPQQREALESGLARLTGAEQMGSLFKVLAAASAGLTPPGFLPHERR